MNNMVISGLAGKRGKREVVDLDFKIGTSAWRVMKTKPVKPLPEISKEMRDIIERTCETIKREFPLIEDI